MPTRRVSEALLMYWLTLWRHPLASWIGSRSPKVRLTFAICVLICGILWSYISEAFMAVHTVQVHKIALKLMSIVIVIDSRMKIGYSYIVEYSIFTCCSSDTVSIIFYFYLHLTQIFVWFELTHGILLRYCFGYLVVCNVVLSNTSESAYIVI